MDIEKEAKKTIKRYKLIRKGDKVVVALSGGKDSTSVIYILHKLGYDVEGLLIDLHLGEWSKIHNEKMTKFCSELGVPLTIVDLKKELGQGICFIKAVLKEKKGLTGCTVCGTVKRWILNKWAKKLGADKLVTGHNLDDEAQNVLMNFLKGNVLLGVNSSPATGGSEVEGFVQRVKPLFFIPESEIRKYAKKKKFDILYDKCPCAFGTYRVDTREWMKCISDGEKMKIVEGFQKLVPKLRGENIREIRKCNECGEPSRGDVCNVCEIFSCLNIE
ncbi:MAG: TIGR00269 family protein [Nanoarchaeota archaeon]|nr:TIGR00269 family protein [Nanoarchaeota archaeon]